MIQNEDTEGKSIVHVLAKQIPWLLTLIFSILVLPSSAWSAMIEVTSIVNAAQTSNTNITRSYTSDSYFAVGAGLLVEGKPMGDSSLSFSSSGSSMEGLYTESGLLYYPRMVGYGTSGIQTSNWMVLPLVEKFHFWSISVGGGVYLAHAMGSIHTTLGTTSGSFAFGTGNLRTTDYGYTLALGYGFSFWNLFMDLRDDVGLRNLTTVTGSTYKFSEYQLLLGVRF